MLYYFTLFSAAISASSVQLRNICSCFAVVRLEMTKRDSTRGTLESKNPFSLLERMG